MRYSLTQGSADSVPVSSLHPLAVRPANHRFFSPLFSTSSESFFWQLLCFHIHLRCPLVFSFPHEFRRVSGSSASMTFWNHRPRVTNSPPQSLHGSQIATRGSHSYSQWAIIGFRHVQSSQARAHQGRAVQHVPGQGNDQARLRQPSRSGSHPQHSPSRLRSRSLDLRTQVPRVRPSLRRQRQLHPQPQMPQVPRRPTGSFPLVSKFRIYRGEVLRSTGFKSGLFAVTIPTAGKNEQTWYTKRMLVASANFPSSAAPIPPNPNASPKNVPDIVPTLLGTSSCANTRIVENADARINPITTLKIPVQNKFAYGSSSVNGSTPKIEYQITTLRPIRSPTGPPKNVPAATAPRNAK